jgi:arylsulfatase A-like enzyme
VPLIVLDPRKPGNKISKDLALNIDVPATMLELAGVPTPKTWQGVSLLSPKLAARKEFLAEHLWQTPIIPPSEAIRTEQWKYFRYINDPAHEELYNLAKDPAEMKNLAADPAYREIKDQLRNRMENLIRDTNSKE